MSIDHLFDNPLTRQRAETGAERKQLLDALHAEKRRSALLQAKVDELVGQIAKMQRAVMPPEQPVRIDKSLQWSEADEKYVAAVRSFCTPVSAREIADHAGVTPSAFLQWYKRTGPRRGVAIHSYVQICGKDVPLYVNM